MERLRLGRIHTNWYPEAFVTAGEALYWLWVPTREGGTLTIQLDPSTRGRIRILGANDQVIAQVADGNELVFAVKRGQMGRFDVRVTPARADVRVTFRRTVWARDGEKPLVPWHFWYFPYRPTSALYPSREVQRSAMRKWDAVLDPSKSRTLASQWEEQEHIKDDPGVGTWEGHCDGAAAASVYFEPPAARGPFTPAELMLLSAEWAGNHAKLEANRWLCWAADTKLCLLDEEPLDVECGHLLQVLRPTDWKHESLIVLVALHRYREAFPALLTRHDARIARSATTLLGSEQGKARVKAAFARALLDLLQFIDQRVGIEGHPLITDIGASGGGTTFAEVWNHVLFHASFEYVETEAEHGRPADPRRVDLHVELAFNEDRAPVQGYEPLPASTSRRTPVLNRSALRLAFSARVRHDAMGSMGEVDFDHLVQHWPADRWLPRMMDALGPPGLAPPALNIHVTDSLLDFVTLRSRYR